MYIWLFVGFRAGIRSLTKAGFICLQLIRAWCLQYQSRRKRRRSLNLARIKKCRKKRLHYFSILRGLCFLKFFDTSKTERAKTFLSFSNKPQAKQDDMGGHVVAISCSKMISIFCHMILCSSKRM